MYLVAFLEEKFGQKRAVLSGYACYQRYIALCFCIVGHSFLNSGYLLDLCFDYGYHSLYLFIGQA